LVPRRLKVYAPIGVVDDVPIVRALAVAEYAGCGLKTGVEFGGTPNTANVIGVDSYIVSPGSYAIAYSGNPNYLTLSSITPSAVQNVATGGSITFTLNFTAPNDFYAPSFTFPAGGTEPEN
jgi:hypothetical protein